MREKRKRGKVHTTKIAENRTRDEARNMGFRQTERERESPEFQTWTNEERAAKNATRTRSPEKLREDHENSCLKEEERERKPRG